ncbi:hypothetical protein [Bacillus velezensis]|uniref:hypothetical protein n=1 Tax=Bacillus velezensis TaxID=492670 RepID=UPI002FBDB670
MSVRAWFGLDAKYDLDNKINKALNRLLELYSTALQKYFKIDYSSNFDDFVKRINVDNLNKQDKIFLRWLTDEGIKSFSILNQKLHDDLQVISSIEYEEYLLNEELDMQYPEDLRNVIISIANNLHGYMSICNESEQAASQERSVLTSKKRFYKIGYGSKTDGNEKPYQRTTKSSPFFIGGFLYGRFDGVLYPLC